MHFKVYLYFYNLQINKQTLTKTHMLAVINKFSSMPYGNSDCNKLAYIDHTCVCVFALFKNETMHFVNCIREEKSYWVLCERKSFNDIALVQGLETFFQSRTT